MSSLSDRLSDRHSDHKTEAIELELLVEGIYRKYGFDFRDFAPVSLKRRVLNVVNSEKVNTITGLLDKILQDKECMERLLLELSVNTTSMFRDPMFFQAFREKVIPVLRTFPFIRIWCAGCSTGEEAYALAILLTESGLYERSRIYATDMNVSLLNKAKAGIFPLAKMQQFTTDYIKSGGKGVFSDYYTARYDGAAFRSFLAKNVIFAQHNLATDGSFNEFHAVLCRNVMIYFNKELQSRVHRLIHDSLCEFGILGLGQTEKRVSKDHLDRYRAFDSENNLFRKKAGIEN